MNNQYLTLQLDFVRGFNGRPALLAPQEVDRVTAMCLNAMAQRDPPTAEQIERAREEQIVCVESAYSESFPRERAKPFLFNEGIAFIPMRGTLVHRNGDAWSGTRGYDDIRREFDSALADPDVAGIVFDAHTGGGMVYGNFELAEHIRSKRGEKPSMTVVNAGAMSGGYSLGSAAKRMVTTPSGDTGSIGVLTMHVDVSEALQKFGVKINLIHAGEHKVDGNPFSPLSDSVRADMQARIDGMWQKFISVVAVNRGMPEQAVRDTQARVYQADEAVKIGLVDAVMSPSDAVATFRAELFGSSTTANRSPTMNQQNTAETAAAASADAAAAAAAGAATTTAPATTTAATPAVDERARCEAITTCEEAKGREALAQHFAYKTDMSVIDAKAALAAAPKTDAVKAGSALEAAMAATGGGANVANNNGDANENADTTEKAGSDLLGAYAHVTGNKGVMRSNG